MKIYKSLDIFLIFFGMFFLFENSTNAINYNWSISTASLYNSGSSVVGIPRFTSNGEDAIFAWIWWNPLDPVDAYSLWCVGSESASDWSIYTSGTYGGYVWISWSGWILYFLIDDAFGNHSYPLQELAKFSETPSGNHPTDWVNCWVIQYRIIGDSNSPDYGIWIVSQTRYQYSGNKVTKNFDSFTWSIQATRDPVLWRRISNINSISPVYQNGWWRIQFTDPNYFFDPSNPWYSYEESGVRRARLIKEFLSGTWYTTDNIINPLPYYYGTTNYIDGNIVTDSTGWIDYYADCTSFLDVGCYIKGSYNAIKGFFTGLVPSIAWSGSMESCAWSWVITQSGILAPLTDLIALLNPFPPPEGTMVCTLLGTSEIKYHVLVPEHNFWEVYGWNQVPEQLKTDMFVAGNQTVIDVLAMFVFTVLVFTTLHKKND